jgi:hypothetical protein
MSSATFMGISSICTHTHTDETGKCPEAGTTMAVFCKHRDDQHPECTLTADCQVHQILESQQHGAGAVQQLSPPIVCCRTAR